MGWSITTEKRSRDVEMFQKRSFSNFIVHELWPINQPPLTYPSQKSGFNKALSREPKVNNPLTRPYFLGGYVMGGWLTSREWTLRFLDLRNESILVHTMTILVVSGAPKFWVAMIFREWEVAISDETVRLLALKRPPAKSHRKPSFSCSEIPSLNLTVGAWITGVGWTSEMPVASHFSILSFWSVASGIVSG